MITGTLSNVSTDLPIPIWWQLTTQAPTRGRFNYLFHPSWASAIALPKQSCIKPHCFGGHPAMLPKKIPHEQKDTQRHKSWFSRQIAKSHEIALITCQWLMAWSPLAKPGEAGARSRTSEALQTWATHLKSQRRNGQKLAKPCGRRQFFGGTAGTCDSGITGLPFDGESKRELRGCYSVTLL